MSALRTRLSILCDLVQRVLEVLVVGIVLLLVVSVLWGVITRFGTQFGMTPSLWTEELSRLLLIWVTFLGAALCFAKRQHLGLDYFANLLDPQAHKWLRIIVEAIVVLFAAVVLVQGGIILVRETLLAEQTTAALQIKMGYVYLAAPLAGVATMLFSLSEIAKLLATETSVSAEPDQDQAAAK